MATEPPRSLAPDQRQAPKYLNLKIEWLLLSIAVALLTYHLAPVLLLVFAGIVLAIALDGLARITAERTPLSRGWALLAITLLIVGLLALFVAAIVPQVAAQVDEMTEAIENAYDAAVGWLSSLGVTSEMLDENTDGGELLGATETAMEHLARWGMSTIGALTSLAVILAITGFAAAAPELYRRGFIGLLPQAKRPLADDTLSAVARGLRWWLLSQLVSMLLLGATVSLGLWVIGIDLWLGLGVLTALLTFVPYLGPLIAAIPVLAIGFADGVQTGLIVTVFYFTVQNVEANVVVPWIQHQVVHLAPVLAISAQLVLGLLFGLTGLILAAPLAVVGMVLVQKLWVEAVLGEESES